MRFMFNGFISRIFVSCVFVTAVFGADPHWDIQYRYRQIDSSLTINDMAFPSATRGIVCGYVTERNDRVRPIDLLTSDGGEHWAETPVKEVGLSLFFLDDSTGWMVTEKGMWSTVESGHSWTRLNKAPAGMLRVWFLTRKHGFAVGTEKRVLETSDGGETWTPLAILKELSGGLSVVFGEIAFTGKNGIISGWNVPFRRGGPDWMEPENAKGRRQVPQYGVFVETVDGGATWTKSEASIFGEPTRVVMTTQGTGLGLLQFKDEFEYPSEVYGINLHGGSSTRSYREKDVSVTDIRLFDGTNRGLLTGYETEGRIHHSPIPGKLKILTSDDREHWTEMPVDYRAVAHVAKIAGPDENHLWISTDTGTILKLVTE